MLGLYVASNLQDEQFNFTMTDLLLSSDTPTCVWSPAPTLDHRKPSFRWNFLIIKF